MTVGAVSVSLIVVAGETDGVGNSRSSNIGFGFENGHGPTCTGNIPVELGSIPWTGDDLIDLVMDKVGVDAGDGFVGITNLELEVIANGGSGEGNGLAFLIGNSNGAGVYVEAITVFGGVFDGNEAVDAMLAKGIKVDSDGLSDIDSGATGNANICFEVGDDPAGVGGLSLSS